MKEEIRKEYELMSYCNKCKKKVATFVIGLFDCCAFCGFPIRFRKNVVRIYNLDSFKNCNCNNDN